MYVIWTRACASGSASKAFRCNSNGAGAAERLPVAGREDPIHLDPVSIVLGFLLGSIPSGLWIGRALGADLKATGSKNIGATNAFRVLGPWWGGAVFLLDTAKGLVASLTPLLTAPAGSISTTAFGIGPSLVPAALAAGMAAILGHMFSPFAGFKGGRGVATSLGVFLGVATYPTLLALASWIALFAATRRVSVGSIGAALVYPFLLLWLAPAGPHRGWIVGAGFAVAALVVVRHIPNIKRLLSGTEPALVGRGKRTEESNS